MCIVGSQCITGLQCITGILQTNGSFCIYMCVYLCDILPLIWCQKLTQKPVYWATPTQLKMFPSIMLSTICHCQIYYEITKKSPTHITICCMLLMCISFGATNIPPCPAGVLWIQNHDRSSYWWNALVDGICRCHKIQNLLHSICLCILFDCLKWYKRS